MYVPEIPTWTSGRVALIGDAAHALSPHISAGGTLGVGDVRVLVHLLLKKNDLQTARQIYQDNRIGHYKKVHKFALAVEHSKDFMEYAKYYGEFSHWMLNEGYKESLV